MATPRALLRVRRVRPPASGARRRERARPPILWRWLRARWKVLFLVATAAALYARWYYLNPGTTLVWTYNALRGLLSLLFALTFAIIQFVAIFWFLSRTHAYWIQPGETGVGFKDYRGNPEVLEQARRVVTLLRGVKEFKEMGGEVSRGLLLTGPPGTGKSYLAQVIANEAGLPFGYLSAASLTSMFWGVGNLKVMNMYRKARKLAQEHGAAIIFLDEFDSIATSRSRQGGGGFPLFGGNLVLNELLLQLDPPRVEGRWWARLLRMVGLRPRPVPQPLVFTMAATNLPEALDPALLRPGRFDRKIVVDAPDFDGRKDVIAYYLSKVAHDPSLDTTTMLDRLAADMVGATPAVIRHVINEAVVKAHFDGRRQITYEDISYARELHEWGLKQPIKSMSEDERRRLAYHEAGHAVAQLKLLPHERLLKTTIVRHGRALGLSATRPVVDRHTLSQEEIMAQLQVALASRAAEELFLGTRLSGAVGDLEQATRLAMAYIGWYGMDGTLYSYAAFGDRAPDDELKARINRLLLREKEKVTEFLKEHAPLVHAVAAGLLAHNELTGDQIEELARLFDQGRLAPDGTVLPPLVEQRPEAVADEELPLAAAAALAAAQVPARPPDPVHEPGGTLPGPALPPPTGDGPSPSPRTTP